MAEYKLNFRYFSSFDANVDVACEVTRLELPASTHIEGTAPPAKAEDPYAPLLEGTDTYLTAHIACNGEVLHAAPVTTYAPAIYDPKRHCVQWDDLLTFPVKYRDLASNAKLVLTLWGLDKRPVGGTAMDFFDENGVLRTGKQKLTFYPFRAGDWGVEHNATPAAAYDECASEDLAFQIEKARESYDFNQVPPVEWLDRVSLPYMSRVLSELSNQRRSQCWLPSSDSPASSAAADKEEMLFGSAYLVLTLPIFHLPVLYEEKAYPGVGLPFASLLPGKPSAIQELCVIYDCDAEADVNPVENKYRKLAHDKFRGIRDPSLKPNKEERERIEAIVASPSDHLRVEDKDLLWTFQFSLTDNKKALTKFLLSVDWSVEQEVEQVPALLEQWRKTTIDFSDALKLLGREKAFQNEVVRNFGVEVLQRATDAEILTYLLQLVQALRYETRVVGGGGTSSPGGTAPGGATGLQQGEGGGKDGTMGGLHSSMLTRFLIERAVKSLELSNFLMWYLRVELDDATCGGMFKAVYDEFHRTLASQNSQLYNMLLKQEAFINKIAAAQRMGREEKGRKDNKEEKLRRLLAEPELTAPPLKDGEYIPIPLDPNIAVTGVVPGTAFMFRSAMYPAVIQFKTFQPSSPRPLQDGDRQHSGSTTGSRKLDRLLSGDKDRSEAVPSGELSYKVIFKNGDDLRQDQLIIQMVTLMDQLLQRVALDLKLKPYRILATGPRDGLMEFVGGSIPVSEVLSKHNASILEFLRFYNPDPSAPLGVVPDVMSTFVKSCAGYCVITYILGIGDRHLDNIMMLPTGHLFHIDFGFIFGNDPKPLPPPFRFTREMADAMGGEGHENYTRFKRYCCQAYNCFRENANLILNLLGLMVDAGIKDLSTDHQAVLDKIEEKFRLDLTVEQAEHHFVSLISESLNALAPIIFENFHRIAVARR